MPLPVSSTQLRKSKPIENWAICEYCGREKSKLCEVCPYSDCEEKKWFEYAEEDLRNYEYYKSTQE